MAAMFDFIRDLFGKEGAGPAKVTLPDIPVIIDRAEKTLDDDPINRTAGQRESISESRQELLDLVNSLSSAEREQAFHPKLEKIAKNTLPLFEKAMLAALSREIPTEPEEFYQAAMESLKGCVKSQAGQGRYLQGVFPEEMKAIRGTIDKFGREMNAMTPVISEARKSRELIRSSRETYDTLIDRMNEKESAIKEKALLEKDIEDLKLKSRKLSADLSKEREDEAAELLQAKKALEESKRKDVENIERQMKATFSSISHVFRKAEKIMQRGGSGKAAKEMHTANMLLSEHGIPAENDLIANVTPFLPAVESMIKSGEIVLKNKEEKAIFSQISEIPALLADLYGRRKLAEDECHEAARRHMEDPHRKRILAIEQEITATEEKLTDTETRLGEIERTIADSVDSIPRLAKQLESRISDLSARETLLELPEGYSAI